jgi:hypothetical protein
MRSKLIINIFKIHHYQFFKIQRSFIVMEEAILISAAKIVELTFLA